MNPLLSVIMPCYNAAAFLSRAVDSALTQTFRELELILVDDGSTDGTPALCEAYAARDPRVQFLRQENAGPSAARNAGLVRASGQYIAFLDADDYLVPDAYARLMDAMAAQGADCACCGYVHVYDEGSDGPTVAAPFPDGVYQGDALRDGIVLPLLQDRLREGFFTGMVWRWVFSRRVIAEQCITFPPVSIMEDELFLIRYFSRPARLVSVDAPLYCYYMNRGSITRSYRADMTEMLQYVLDAKAALVEEYRIPVRADWRDNCAWMELLADVGNEFGRGHDLSLRAHCRDLKALAALPEYRRALENYVPRDMNRRKTLVAWCLRHRLYLPLTLLYKYKNRNN